MLRTTQKGIAMTNVGGVKGEGVPEPTGPKRKKRVDSQSFKEMMKVGKAREVDPEEKRKRKRREEVEEETKAELAGTAPSQGAPKTEEKVPAPFEPKIRGAGAAPAEPSEEEPSAPPPPPPFFPPEAGPDFSTPSITPQQAEQQAAPAPATHKKGKKKPAIIGPQEPTPKIEKKKVKETAPPPLKAEKKEMPEKPPYREEEKETFFTTLAKGEAKKTEEKKAEQPPVEEVVSPLPPGAWEATKISPEDKKKIEKKEEQIQPIETGPVGTQPTPLDISIPTPPITSTSPFVNLPPQVMQIFERMVGVMTIMTSSGITETTIHLDAPQFQGSVFFGAQITITEFSTAPKAFNIEFIGSPQGVNLFKGSIEELVAAFQAGNYNFKVHRVDTSLSPREREEKPKVGKVKRKQGKKG